MKNLSLVLALILALASFCSFAAGAEEDGMDFPCGGVIDAVEVHIVYAPLTSRIGFGNSEPRLTGTILKIIYPDGNIEYVTVEASSDGYYAGEFTVSDHLSDDLSSDDFGFVDRSIYIYTDHTDRMYGYSGIVDYVYLDLPTLTDILNRIDNYIEKKFLF